jgi:hypothetical protein
MAMCANVTDASRTATAMRVSVMKGKIIRRIACSFGGAGRSCQRNRRPAACGRRVIHLSTAIHNTKFPRHQRLSRLDFVARALPMRLRVTDDVHRRQPCGLSDR